MYRETTARIHAPLCFCNFYIEEASKVWNKKSGGIFEVWLAAFLDLDQNDPREKRVCHP